MIKIKKKDLLLTLLLFMLFTPVTLAGITGSEHDFSAQGWNPSGEICIVCHTPHNGDTQVVSDHLWNHAITSATYTLYSSPTLDATMEQPGGISKLCLSCHDGTIAVDSFGGATGSKTIDQFPNGNGLIGTDLSDDHPVGFRWEHQTVATCTLDCHFGNGDPYSYTVRFYNHRVECSTCHDPHNNQGPSDSIKMLRMSMAGSALCLLCHNGK